MNFSDFDFFELEFSTKSRIFDTVDSPNTLVVLILTVPERLMQPEITSSPDFALRGTLSPVSAAVSSDVVPSTITPSIGIFSPALTTIILPISTSSGSTVSILPSRSTFA